MVKGRSERNERNERNERSERNERGRNREEKFSSADNSELSLEEMDLINQVRSSGHK